MSQEHRAASGGKDLADEVMAPSDQQIPGQYPSRRARREAERQAQQHSGGNASHKAPAPSHQPSFQGRRGPITGVIPAVPARSDHHEGNTQVPQQPKDLSASQRRQASASQAKPGRSLASALTTTSATTSQTQRGTIIGGGAAENGDKAEPKHDGETLPALTGPPKASRAGRNLPAAIGVGLGLLIAVLVGLLIYPPAFMLMVMAASALGVWEVKRGFLQQSLHPPAVPIGIAVIGLPVVAYYGGPEALLFGFVASCLAVLLWCALDRRKALAQNVVAGIFIIAWVPFLICFVLLMLREQTGPATLFSLTSAWPSEGALRVATVLLLVVANDTFGYLVGALFGKHPMAPKVSPKKSWEGFAGSVSGAMLIGVLVAVFLLREPFWFGMVMALFLVAAATVGDLAESMIKRELGIKDMSSILPGHGGLMDRLDSILFAAPMGYLIFEGIDWLNGLA